MEVTKKMEMRLLAVRDSVEIAYPLSVFYHRDAYTEIPYE